MERGAGIKLDGIAATTGVSDAQCGSALAPRRMRGRWIFLERCQSLAQAACAERNFGEGAARPGIGTQLRCPLALDPSRRRGFIHRMSQLMGDYRHDSALAVGVVQSCEELRRVDDFRIPICRDQHGIGRRGVTEYGNLRTIWTADGRERGVYLSRQLHSVGAGPLILVRIVRRDARTQGTDHFRARLYRQQ